MPALSYSSDQSGEHSSKANAALPGGGAPDSSGGLFGRGLDFGRALMGVAVIAVMGMAVVLRRRVAGIGAAVAAAALAVIGAVEPGPLEDHCRKADLASGLPAALWAGVLRWCVEALGELVFVSAFAPVVV